MNRKVNGLSRADRFPGKRRTTGYQTVLLRAGAALMGLCLLAGAVSGCRGVPPHGEETGTDVKTEMSGTMPDGTEPGTPGDDTVPTGADETLPDLPETEVPGGDDVPTTLYMPRFSVPGGFLDGTARLELTLPDGCPTGALIRYTLDGSEPTAQSAVYDKPIPVLNGTESAVVRAAVFADGRLCGHIVTHTYLKAGVTSLRVVSLAVDPEDLYDETSGILSNRDGSGKEWERPASIEIFDTDGTLLIRQDGGIRLSGAGSRSFDPASLRLVARKSSYFDDSGVKYDGAGKFKAALFPGEDCAAYDRFLLRNGGNDSFYQARSGFLRMNMMRDAIANNVCAALERQIGVSVFAQREVPVAVFLNGVYYGMLNMKQDFDDDLVESLYGLAAEDVTVIKGKKNGKDMYYQVESGAESELAAWQALYTYAAEHALAADYAEAYDYVSARMDVENYVWYMAVMTYLCNTDWPQNNTMVWRYTGASEETSDGASGDSAAYADGKWRFVIRDMDLCFALHDAPSQTSSTTYTMADTDTLWRLLVFYRDGNGYTYDASTGLYADAMGFQGLFDFFMRSSDFREKFAAACEYLMSDRFTDMLTAEMDAYASQCQPEIPAHLARWQTEGKIHAAYSMQNWQASLTDMKTFVRERPGYFRTYLENAFSYYE